MGMGAEQAPTGAFQGHAVGTGAQNGGSTRRVYDYTYSMGGSVKTWADAAALALLLTCPLWGYWALRGLALAMRSLGVI